MAKLKIITLLLFQFYAFSYGQVTFSGFVKDIETGEVLIGASIVNTETNRGTITDPYGYFSISCKKKSIISFSYVSYKELVLSLVAHNDTIFEIFLKKGVDLEEVVIAAPKHIAFNTAKLSVKEIKNIPSLGGSPDVLKAMQLLPGIQTQSEGSSMLIVRGGSPGQNMYLLDNTPLIYVNHLGGFMSVFNPDMINDISILKGGFPAQYGGKLSSIVNIAQRSGDTSEFKGSFGMGITDVNLSLEGRLGKNASYIFTGRKTLFDALLYLGSSLSEGNESNIAYGFHDLNSKVSWKMNMRNSLFFNIYQGDDYFNAWSKKDSKNSIEKSHLKNVWGNWLFSTGWNYVASANLFGESGISYTRYRLKNKQSLIKAQESDYENIFTSSVQDFSLRTAWNYRVLPIWLTKFGLQSSILNHTPNALEQIGVFDSYNQNSINSVQSAIFIENKIDPLKNIKLNIGLRTVYYSIKEFSTLCFEPRFDMSIDLPTHHKLNLSYMHVTQNSHLLFASGNSIMATEVWIPATQQILPSSSKQVSMSWSANILNNMISTEIGVYYKHMSSLATYKDGYIDLKNNRDWQSIVETGGKGTSYGIELFIKKNYGTWTGSFGYDYSHTTRKFDKINNGIEYFYEYHRPHSISLMINRKINDKWDFNAVWIYQSGLPYTPAIGRKIIMVPDHIGENCNAMYREALIYGERNSSKMKDYHRLDVGFNYTKITQKRKLKAVWSFSIYNLYNRQNPNMYYYNDNATDEFHIDPIYNEDYKPLNLYQVSLFSIMPSVSYKVYFNKSDLKRKTKDVNWFKDWLYQSSSQ